MGLKNESFEMIGPQNLQKFSPYAFQSNIFHSFIIVYIEKDYLGFIKMGPAFVRSSLLHFKQTLKFPSNLVTLRQL